MRSVQSFENDPKMQKWNAKHPGVVVDSLDQLGLLSSEIGHREKDIIRFFFFFSFSFSFSFSFFFPFFFVFVFVSE